MLDLIRAVYWASPWGLIWNRKKRWALNNSQLHQLVSCIGGTHRGRCLTAFYNHIGEECSMSSVAQKLGASHSCMDREAGVNLYVATQLLHRPAGATRTLAAGIQVYHSRSGGRHFTIPFQLVVFVVAHSLTSLGSFHPQPHPH